VNPVEQKKHTTRTDQLADDIGTLDELHRETARRTQEHGRQLEQIHKDLDAHSMALRTVERLAAQMNADLGRIVGEHRADFMVTRDDVDAEIAARLAFQRQTLWSRLKWLIAGR
jgi:hypothetical protein